MSPIAPQSLTLFKLFLLCFFLYILLTTYPSKPHLPLATSLLMKLLAQLGTPFTAL